MVYAKIGDATQAGKTVAEIPMFIWHMSTRLCKHGGRTGELGGMILNSYILDYTLPQRRHWLASLWSGIRTWWRCRSCY